MPWLTGQGTNLIFLKYSDQFLKIYDQGWLEFYSRKGLGNKVADLNFFNIKFQANSLKLHFLIFLVWLLLSLIYLLCFYSLNVKHSTEDAGIVNDLKTSY